jgi:hypothetical protein
VSARECHTGECGLCEPCLRREAEQGYEGEVKATSFPHIRRGAPAAAKTAPAPPPPPVDPEELAARAERAQAIERLRAVYAPPRPLPRQERPRTADEQIDQAIARVAAKAAEPPAPAPPPPPMPEEFSVGARVRYLFGPPPRGWGERGVQRNGTVIGWQTSAGVGALLVHLDEDPSGLNVLCLPSRTSPLDAFGVHPVEGTGGRSIWSVGDPPPESIVDPSVWRDFAPTPDHAAIKRRGGGGQYNGGLSF